MTIPARKNGEAYVPTDEDRAFVVRAASHGTTQDMIAKRIGISMPTLRKHYRAELDQGHAKACDLMSKTLYQRGRKGDTACAIFFAKTRMGWSEHKPTAAELVLLQTVRSLRINPADLAEVLRLSGMNDEQKEANREIVARLKQLKEGQP